jgi:transcriptional antiterminator RfaH
MKHVAFTGPNSGIHEHWYLVQLKPGGLGRAKLNLARQGFETFMPLRAQTLRKRGQLRTEERPLFPGYLFVRLDPTRAPWRAINNTYGVARLVCLGGNTPNRVPSGLVEEMINVARDGEWVPDPDMLKVGEDISLITGPFAGAIARIAAAPEGDRVLVLMEMMGQEVRAAVPLCAVENTS